MKSPRQQTIRRIDALHADIARLIDTELRYLNRVDPLPNDLLRGIRSAGLQVLSWSPARRASMGTATASLPIDD